MQIFYHATSIDNLGSILVNGLQPRNIERIVYLCKKPEECLRFAFVQGVKHVLICKVRVDEKNIIETFDHNEQFFKCRCFGSTKPIPCENIIGYTKYEL